MNFFRRFLRRIQRPAWTLTTAVVLGTSIYGPVNTAMEANYKTRQENIQSIRQSNEQRANGLKQANEMLYNVTRKGKTDPATVAENLGKAESLLRINGDQEHLKVLEYCVIKAQENKEPFDQDIWDSLHIVIEKTIRILEGLEEVKQPRIIYNTAWVFKKDTFFLKPDSVKNPGWKKK